jgi:hypothetical protein
MKHIKLFEQFIVDPVNEMDLNDPVMMKLRAAQIKRNQNAAKNIDLEKQNKNASKIKALKAKRAEIMRDMEKEAEVEGGPVADKYGDMLNKIDNDIIKLGGNPMTESLNEKKAIDLDQLIDVLANLEDAFTEEEFIEFGEDVSVDPKTMRKIFNDYWNLKPVERLKYSTEDWAQWLRKNYKIQ